MIESGDPESARENGSKLGKDNGGAGVIPAVKRLRGFEGSYWVFRNVDLFRGPGVRSLRSIWSTMLGEGVDGDDGMGVGAAMICGVKESAKGEGDTGVKADVWVKDEMGGGVHGDVVFALYNRPRMAGPNEHPLGTKLFQGMIKECHDDILSPYRHFTQWVERRHGDKERKYQGNPKKTISRTKWSQKRLSVNALGANAAMRSRILPIGIRSSVQTRLSMIPSPITISTSAS